MEDDTYIHVEFQTADKWKDDFRRFRAYEITILRNYIKVIIMKGTMRIIEEDYINEENKTWQ